MVNGRCNPHWSRVHTRGALGVIVFLIILAAVRSAFGPRSDNGGIVHRPRPQLMDPLQSPQLITFWADFEQTLLEAKPDGAPVRPWRSVSSEEEQADPNTAVRLDYIKMDENDIKALSVSHGRMVGSLVQLAPQLPYERGTRGVVMSAGGKYFGVAVISIRMLRRSGSKLPVQVFLDTWDDYDIIGCEHILPSLNARCLVLAEIWSKARSHVSLEKYQYKVFALVFSSFEDIIFLDADAFPAYDPDHLLDVEPFLSTGLVTWPDFWISTSSHYFYEIAGLEVPPLTIRTCSESGIMIYSKRMHADSLLLSAYYNYYGPSHYYPLLSQGATGEGDKETFLHAALALGKSFYDVRTPVSVMGDWVDGEWYSAGMKQADPAKDWAIQRGKQTSQKQNETAAIATSAINSERTKSGAGEPPRSGDFARPFFIHNNIVKLNVQHLFEEPTYWANKETGHFIRLWGDADGVINEFGYDAEHVLWDEMVIAACDIGRTVCERAKTYFQAVFPER